jgi:hypothetical protein
MSDCIGTDYEERWLKHSLLVVGQRVFIPGTGQYGTITQVWPDGQAGIAIDESSGGGYRKISGAHIEAA